MSYGTVTQMGGLYKIEFTPIKTIVEAVKQLPERAWDWSNKYWTVPVQYRDEVERFAKRHKLQFGAKHVEEPDTNFVIDPLPELTISIPLKVSPKPYQPPGIAYILQKERLIVGDDMGLGKTFQSIAGIAGFHHSGKQVFPCLVICPSSVKENWKREFEAFTNFKAILLSDAIKNNWYEYYRAGLAQVFIVNYESLKKFFVSSVKEMPKGKRPKLNDISFKPSIELIKSAIVDECHRVKDSKTLGYKFTRGICKNKEVILALTGTAVVNSPIDLASQLAIVDRLKDFGGYTYFEQRFCAGMKRASNLKELNYLLNKICYYRRNKTDPEIKKHLPDKLRQIVTCELSPAARKEYNHAQADLETYMKQYKEASDDQIQKSMKGEVMVRIGILKNISARGKLHDAFDYIRDVVENGEKIVVFANLTEIIHQVQQNFPKSVRVTGAEDAQQKQAAVDKFQNDPNTKVIVCNLKAAGVGITLTAAHQVCFIEFGWHAAIMDQAEDRCYRLGQHSNVMCTYFLGRNTIDEWNYNLIQSKREIMNTVIGNEDNTETSVIDQFMTLFSK